MNETNGFPRGWLPNVLGTAYSAQPQEAFRPTGRLHMALNVGLSYEPLSWPHSCSEMILHGDTANLPLGISTIQTFKSRPAVELSALFGATLLVGGALFKKTHTATKG